MVCCPMTTQEKGYPFEVLVSAPGGGVILAGSIAELREVRAKLIPLLGGAPAFAAGQSRTRNPNRVPRRLQ